MQRFVMAAAALATSVAAAQDLTPIVPDGALRVLVAGDEVKLGKVGGKSDLTVRLWGAPTPGCAGLGPCAQDFFLAVQDAKDGAAMLVPLGTLGAVLAHDLTKGEGADEARLRLIVLPAPLAALLVSGGTAQVETRDYLITPGAVRRAD